MPSHSPSVFCIAGGYDLRIVLVFVLTLLAGSFSLPSAASAQDAALDDAVFGFAGRYVNAYIGGSLVPISARYEDNFVLGGGYQKFVAEPLTDLHLGLEAGLALRGGVIVSGEAWLGAVARYDGFHLGENLRISPAITVGLSAVTNPIGIEAERAQRRNADPSLLFFMAPEIAVSTVDNPDIELFYRVQHRSGAWGTLGGMADGANAQVIGMRYRF